MDDTKDFVWIVLQPWATQWQCDIFDENSLIC